MQFEMYIERLDRKWSWQIEPDQLAIGTKVPATLNQLLYMGPSSPPYAFCERGMPVKGNLSPQAEVVFSAVENPVHCSWVTRADLIKKSAELFVIPDADARKWRVHLINFIKTLPKWEGDPAHQRIVYWG